MDESSDNEITVLLCIALTLEMIECHSILWCDGNKNQKWLKIIQTFNTYTGIKMWSNLQPSSYSFCMLKNLFDFFWQKSFLDFSQLTSDWMKIFADFFVEYFRFVKIFQWYNMRLLAYPFLAIFLLVKDTFLVRYSHLADNRRISFQPIMGFRLLFFHSNCMPF